MNSNNLCLLCFIFFCVGTKSRSSGSPGGVRRGCTSSTWPRPCRAVVDGDIMLGGLHMVHERNEDLVCGRIMPQGGLQAAEVMLYTLEKANQLVLKPIGIRLGGIILDDCDRDTYGLQQAT